MYVDLNKYVGIPHKKGACTMIEADCWGVTQMASRDEFGVEIKMFEGATFEGDALSDIIDSEIISGRWEVCEPDAGVLCVMYSKMDNRPDHIGICSDPQHVLHSFGGKQTGASGITKISVLSKVFSKMEFYSYAA